MLGGFLTIGGALASNAYAGGPVAPEIDPGGIAASVTILTGGVLILSSMRHKK
jgi:hypothetical protein